MPASLELVRPHNCLLAGLAVLIGSVVAWGGTELPRITPFAFAAAALICGGGNAINDYCDRKIDAINRPERPIPSGRISPSRALAISRTFFIAGVLLAIPLGLPCVSLAILNSLILAIYAAELKRMGLVGNLAIGYLVGSTFLFGGLAVDRLQAVSILAAMALLSTAGRELIKDIEDMKGDKKIGIETFPICYGPRAAAALAIAFIVAAIVISPAPYLLGYFDVSYLGPIIISVAIFTVAAFIVARSQSPQAAGQASLACKAGMGIGLAAFLAGAIA